MLDSCRICLGKFELIFGTISDWHQPHWGFRGTVSAMTLERCPPSACNRVRHRVEYALIRVAVADMLSLERFVLEQLSPIAQVEKNTLALCLQTSALQNCLAAEGVSKGSKVVFDATSISINSTPMSSSGIDIRCSRSSPNISVNRLGAIET